MDLFTTAQVAATLGLAPRRIRQLAESRNLGMHIGDRLLFTAEEVEAMRVRVPGRPKVAK